VSRACRGDTGDAMRTARIGWQGAGGRAAAGGNQVWFSHNADRGAVTKV